MKCKLSVGCKYWREVEKGKTWTERQRERGRSLKRGREKPREGEIGEKGEEGGERREGSWMNQVSQEDQEP